LLSCINLTVLMYHGDRIYSQWYVANDTFVFLSSGIWDSMEGDWQENGGGDGIEENIWCLQKPDWCTSKFMCNSKVVLFVCVCRQNYLCSIVYKLFMETSASLTIHCLWVCRWICEFKTWWHSELCYLTQCTLSRL